MIIEISTPEESGFEQRYHATSDQNPYLKYGVSVTHGEVVATLCLYENECITYQDAAVLLFGNLYIQNDQDLFDALLEAATKIANKHNKHFLIGPMNGSVWQDYRTPVTSAQPAFTGDLVLPLFYADLLKKNGFNKIETYHTFQSAIDLTKDTVTLPENISVRPIEVADINNHENGLYDLCEQAFRNNHFYSPLSHEVFITKYLAMIQQIDRELVLVAVEGNRPIAFVLSYEDPARKGTLIIKTIARHPQYHYPGLVTNMVQLLMNKAASLGFTHTIHAFMHEDNKSLQRSKEFGGAVLRSYALFGKNTGIE